MRHLIWILPVFCSLSYGLTVGSTAPDFTLKGSDGKEYGLRQALRSHQAAAIVFVSTQCPYSNSYNGRYNELADGLAERAGGKKVAFLAINSNADESWDDIKKHAAAQKFRFPILKDEANRVADLYGATKTPEVFLVGSKLELLYHGRIDDDTEGKSIQRRDLVVAVDEYLSGKPIRNKETKAFGCSIKRQ